MNNWTCAGFIVAALWTLPAFAQDRDSVRTADAFLTADWETKRDILRDLIMRQNPWTPGEVRQVVEVGLTDATPAVREGVLAAIVSRIGPLALAFPNATEAIRTEEFAALAPLRPTIAVVLSSDPDARVRREALRAFGALDPGNRTVPPGTTPSQEAIDVLIARFREDPDAGVRSLAVSVLAAIPVLSEASNRVFLEALSDPHPAVRHAATAGLARLQPPEAIGYLRPLLDDPNPQVRIQAAIALAKFGRLATPHLEALRAVVAGESNQQLREQLQSLLRTLER